MRLLKSLQGSYASRQSIFLLLAFSAFFLARASAQNMTTVDVERLQDAIADASRDVSALPGTGKPGAGGRHPGTRPSVAQTAPNKRAAEDRSVLGLGAVPGSGSGALPLAAAAAAAAAAGMGGTALTAAPAATAPTAPTPAAPETPAAAGVPPGDREKPG